MQVVQEAAGHEALLAGLADGCVLQLRLGSPFPTCLLQHGAAIRCGPCLHR
jgi:hypothetical protein